MYTGKGKNEVSSEGKNQDSDVYETREGGVGGGGMKVCLRDGC